jgi:hypothetical protein
MNPDPLKQTWQTQTSQTGLTIDVDRLLPELRRNQQRFTTMIFWRDVREVGIGLLMVPLWVYLGIKQSLPWTWYLTVPALLWIAGFMLADRRRHHRQAPQPSEPLRQHVANALAQVDHQIWLLRNVVWWHLLPLALSIFAFFGHVAWQLRSGGWPTALTVAAVAVIAAIILVGVYRLNQNAVRTELLPRRQELEALLMSLQDEPPAPSTNPPGESPGLEQSDRSSK